MAHFLKRLELNGFKSFAQRTTLEFPSGITAIVGPNGSGKSNVVDAIRWLLGERDAKNLRGGKVEDLIFAGTAKRPRTGLAQASLHFENKNKFFPVDFEEVSVMREVRRDGASRYFLNKSEVLLRDLVDFFARARLGSRGMIVVTQGNSDMFIRATPAERREMIEEILGLREYQIKKLDAERRLKNSQINLDKAKALGEEILPHLRSLKRQTGRWEKRESLEADLRNLENQFFGSAWNELEEKLKAVERDIAEHKTGFETFEKERRAAEARQKEVEASQPKEREELRKIKGETQALIEARSKLQKDLGRLEAQIELERNDIRAEGAPSPQRIAALLEKIREELKRVLDADAEALRGAVENILREINAELKGTRSDENAPPKLAAQFEKIEADLESLERKLLGLKEQEKTLEKNQEEFYQSFKAAVAALEAAKDRIERWEAEHQKKLFEKERFELRRGELEHQIIQAGRRPEEFRRLELAPGSPGEDPASVERRIFKLRGDLASIGEVDEALMKEAKETEDRYHFLKKEAEDLERAKADLAELIGNLNEKIHTEFSQALVRINGEFDKFFGLMFSGGHGKLKLVIPAKPKAAAEAEEDGEEVGPEAEKPEEEKEPEGGIEIELKLPRKRISSLDVLSGGERSLVGIAALFAMVAVSPPPFLVLDEIDAPLDDRNARRFADMLKEFSKKTQFIVVTHNRATMEAANVLYGVTLNEDGTSKLVSLKLE